MINFSELAGHGVILKDQTMAFTFSSNLNKITIILRKGIEFKDNKDNALF